jgi:hypothetical protein
MVLVSGCIGMAGLSKQSDMKFMTADGTLCSPDNCTKCHLAWAERFEYFRGWDRYGYIFDRQMVPGYYDPWVHPEIENMFEVYYTTDWWESDESKVWPDTIAGMASDLSVCSRDSGMPSIPNSPDAITGPVIEVAPFGKKYTSIANAVKKAKSGTTVFVHAGEYNECIELKDGVSLVGEDPETTIINPHNAGHAIIAANHSLIAGFTLTGTGIDYSAGRFNCAVYVSGCDSTCIIAGNIFRENGLFGVWIDGNPDDRANSRRDRTHSPRMIEVVDRTYEDYPNPVIAGNTFYRIGQRAVFCVHSRGEVFNNIFSGNVKAMGLEQHSRPFVHHNVFYFNNVPMAINRSEPLVCNNIFLRNQWGQRMLRGANPFIFNNVNHNSPFFRDFNESGLPTPYDPVPGTGERTLDPCFSAPLNGDFTFANNSPLYNETQGFEAVGIMRDTDLPQPAAVSL